MVDWLFHLAVLAVLATGSMTLALVRRARHRGELGGDLVVGLLAGAVLTLALLAALALARAALAALPTVGGWARAALLVGLAAAGTVLAAVLISLASVRRPLATLTFAWRGMPLPWLALLLTEGSGLRWPALALCLALALASLCALLLAPRRPRPAALTLADDDPGAGADDVVLLSWNVGQAPPDNGPSRRGQLPRIARVIREAGVDVACLQELRDAGHLDTLLGLLGPGWRGALGNTDRQKVNALLTRLPGPLAGLAFARFRAPVALDLAGARVLSMHFPTSRARDRAAFADWLEEHAARLDRPLVIAGDCNMDPEGHWDRVTTLFTDDLALDQCPLDRLRALGTDIGAGAAATAMPSRRLDRVLVAAPLAPVSFRVLFGSARGLMDHQPVLARLRPGPPSPGRLDDNP